MVTKLAVVTEVIENEFPNTMMKGQEQKILDMLLKNHKYIFDRHYYLSSNYYGSKQYWQLYSCITGVLSEIFFN